MAAIITDQLRILNAKNFVAGVQTSSNSYYAFIGLPNPEDYQSDWDTSPPSPKDSLDQSNDYWDTMLAMKKINSSDVSQVVRKVQWASGITYDMWRNDITRNNPSQPSGSFDIYSANYYVMNSDFRVYICIENGATPSNPSGNSSQDEPNFTDLEPTKAGSSGDGYFWKYLFTVSPSDIIKFDSTEYITLPPNWSTSIDPQVSVIRDNGDSSVNNNQLKTVSIKNAGFGYGLGLDVELDILGDGTGGKVVVSTDTSGRIINAQISAGGSGYSYGVIDLGPIQSGSLTEFAELIPIIPPSKGHGFDIYTELGAEKVLVYGRFDDSTKNFPTDTQFAQVGIVKNPTSFGSTSNFTSNDFSATGQIKVVNPSGSLVVGNTIKQIVGTTTAVAYVASFDEETNVIKYIQDRTLYFNKTTGTQRDYIGVTSESKYVNFESSAESITTDGGFSASVDTTFAGITTILGNNVVNLGVNFTDGIANPQINKRTGEIIYLDNRPTIARNSRQKEDIKVVLEF